MSAIVCNCAYNGLSIVRELGRKGVDVHAVDSFRNVGTVSRYATFHGCPNPTVAEAEFVDFMLELCSDLGDDPVIIPTNDHWAAVVARHRDRLSRCSRPLVPSGEVVDLLLDKHRFHEWADERDYPVPRSWRHTELDDVDEEAFPVAAKPIDARLRPDMMFRSSAAVTYNRILGDGGRDASETRRLRRQAETIEDNRLRVIEDRTELKAFVESHRGSLEDYLFQEYIRGDSDRMYTVGVYADRDHVVRGMFTGRKVRGFPPDVGDCKLGQAESVPPWLERTAEELVEDVEFHGIAEFEFKRDSRTDEFCLIEVNPRSWSWVGITPDAGVNLPWLAYLDATTSADVGYRENDVETGEAKWVKVTEDLPNCLWLNAREGYPEWDLSLREWWESVSAPHLVTAEFDLRDPLPGVYALGLAGLRLAGEVT